MLTKNFLSMSFALISIIGCGKEKESNKNDGITHTTCGSGKAYTEKDVVKLVNGVYKSLDGKKRVTLTDEAVSYEFLDDAQNVIAILKYKIKNKSSGLYLK